MTDKDESLHGQAMAKFEKAIALIKDAAYLEYCAAEMLQPCHDMHTILWCSAANLNSLAGNDERALECVIKAVRTLVGKHHSRKQLNEILIRSVRRCPMVKVATDILDSSNDYVELLVRSIETVEGIEITCEDYVKSFIASVNGDHVDTVESAEIKYEDFNRFYWFDDHELRPRLIATLEKHGMKEGVNFLIPNESISVIKVVSAYTNVLDELKRFIALLEDLGGLQ